MRVVEVERLFSELDREKYRRNVSIKLLETSIMHCQLRMPVVLLLRLPACLRLEFAAIAVSSEEDDMMKIVAAQVTMKRGRMNSSVVYLMGGKVS